jgi:uncharacterized protein YjiS (DUF1127 family)
MSLQSRNRLIAPRDLFSTPCAPRSRFTLRAAFMLALWRERIRMRRALAGMHARSLRDAGISPAAAAYESGKPFWRTMGDLR